ncbi:MAG: hypothetical protein ACREJ5_23455 [Geminicoccaceae bacterium]
MGSMCLLPGAGLAARYAISSAHAEVSGRLRGAWTGQMSWHGEQHQRAVELAVAELKNAGGVLGENACHVKIAGYRRGAAQAPNPL